MKDRIESLLATVFGGIFLLLSAVVAVETVSRKVFNVSLQGADELGGYALAVGSTIAFSLALMGRNHPLGIILASILFGALYQGGSQLSFDMPKINRDMVVVLQGLVILFCGAMENVFRAPLATVFARQGRPATPK